MKNFSVLFLITYTIFLSAQSFAYCEPDYINRKTSDGSVIILSSGVAWEINSAGRINTSLWLPGEEVFVCDDDSIINKSNGDKVYARKIY